MDEVVFFCSDYITARTRFRTETKRLNWHGSSYPIDELGPGGEDLTIDVATSPARSSDRVLIVSSGSHGVEGFFGSAVQLALLREWERNARLQTVRIVFLHGLNPYGFACSRRADANNVDLNRNFLLDGEQYHGCPAGYSELDPILNPWRAPNWTDPLFLQGLWALIRYGKPALKQIIAGGQFDFPRGLFFGGHGPSATQEIIRQHMRSWIGTASSVIHLDLHTGQGRWATHKLLLDHPRLAPEFNQAKQWFGAANVEPTCLDGVSYQLRGSFARWCAAQKFAANYLFAYAEFGSYCNSAVLAGLRVENQAHHWSAQAEHPAKARLRELFCPRSSKWRASVINQSIDLVHRAAAALSAWQVSEAA